MEKDHEDIDLWWSQDDRVFKWQAKWNSGVAYRFPAMNVLGVFAAAPVATSGANAALATIAANSANIKDYSTVLGNVKSDLDTIATKSAGLDDLASIKTSASALADADHVFKTKEQA